MKLLKIFLFLSLIRLFGYVFVYPLLIPIGYLLNQISPYLIKAVFIAEDDKFFRHEGFEL